LHEAAPATDLAIEGQWVSPTDRPKEETWAALVERARRAGCSWVDEVVALAPTIGALAQVQAEQPRGGVVITNRDITIDTVRLGPSGTLVLMHWDFAGPMLPEWELASVLFHWTGDGARNEDAAAPLMAGYRARRGGAPPVSLESFSSVITGGLTWLLHRAWEASEPGHSEKRAFAERALREVLDEPLTVQKLERLVGAATGQA
jgi:hypothetical protein